MPGSFEPSLPLRSSRVMHVPRPCPSLPAALALAALLAFGPSPARAQYAEAGPEWSVRHWTSRNGLPQNSVNAIVQAEDGFIWIGTFGGLVRFDGVEFQIFDLSNTPLLNEARILSLLESSRGDLWIGLQNGRVLSYRAGAFELLVSGGIGEVHYLAEGADGSVWFGTTSGVFRSSTPGAPPERLLGTPGPRHFVTRVGEDIVYTHTRERYIAEGGALPGRPLPGFERPLTAAAQVGERRWWAGPNGFVLEDGSERVEGTDFIRAMAATAAGEVFAAGGDLLRFRGTVADTIPLTVDNAPVRLFESMLVDREGSVWIGSRGGGLFQLRRSAVLAAPFPHPPEGLVPETFFVAPVAGGDVWVSTCPELYSYASPNQGRLLSPPARECLSALAQHRDGRLFTRISTDGALAELDSLGRVIEVGPSRLDELAVDLEGRVHRFMADGTVERLDPEGWTARPEVVPPTGIATAVFLPSGLWMGGDDGTVHHLSPEGRLRIWTTADGIVPGQKRSVAEDEEGRVWVASYGGGLTLIEPGGQVRVFDPGEGLPDAFLSEVIPFEGGLWLIGNRALARVDYDAIDAVLEGRATDLRPLIVEQASGYMEPAGSQAFIDPETRLLWYGSIEGPRVLDIANFPRNPAPPPIHVTEVLVDGAVWPVTEGVPADAEEIEIRYTSPSFLRPAQIRFEYRISDRWIDAGDRRSAFFSALPPGSYSFEVRAFNDEGGTSAAPAVLEFEVLPAFWETVWFRIASVLLAGLAVWASIRWTTAVERRRRRELEVEIRERKRLERERQQLSEQLLRAQKLESIGRLTGGIAHDFNNLLMIVTASLEMARVAKDEAERIEGIDTAMRAAFRGGALTRQLLAFSRRGAMRFGRIRFADVIEELDQVLQRSLGERYHVSVDLEQGLHPLVSDEDGLHNVLLNLAINARDAMPGGGSIQILARNRRLDEEEAAAVGGVPAGEYVRIGVRDEGTGIERETLERVFDPFFTTKPVGEGTGLGLSMVHGFAAQSGGFVEIDTEVGAGTTVWVHLPASLTATGELEDAPPRTAPKRGDGERILLVEDNARVREVTIELLRGYGFEVRAVADTAAAEAALREERPDLLLTDVVLPNESGVVFARRVRERDPSLPIVLATGFAPDGVVEEARGFRVLEKPFTGDALVRTIQEEMARTGTGAASEG